MTNEEIQFEDILIIGDSMDIDFKKSQKKMEQMLILQKKEILEKIEGMKIGGIKNMPQIEPRTAEIQEHSIVIGYNKACKDIKKLLT